MGQTGQRRGGRGLRELRTVKETKQKAEFFFLPPIQARQLFTSLFQFLSD
jgi:hypothetical protein